LWLVREHHWMTQQSWVANCCLVTRTWLSGSQSFINPVFLHTRVGQQLGMKTRKADLDDGGSWYYWLTKSCWDLCMNKSDVFFCDFTWCSWAILDLNWFSQSYLHEHWRQQKLMKVNRDGNGAIVKVQVAIGSRRQNFWWQFYKVGVCSEPVNFRVFFPDFQGFGWKEQPVHHGTHPSPPPCVLWMCNSSLAFTLVSHPPIGALCLDIVDPLFWECTSMQNYQTRWMPLKWNSNHSFV
jgi:hypothetical protein